MTDEFLDQLRTAFESQDVDAIAPFLAPDVTWGAPGDPSPACRSRRQVLEWYRRGLDGGVRGFVREMTALGDKVIVGLVVTGNEAAEQSGGSVERWQVLAIHAGLVSDIRGFDDRVTAFEYASVPPS